MYCFPFSFFKRGKWRGLRAIHWFPELAWELGRPGSWVPVLNHCTDSPLCLTLYGWCPLSTVNPSEQRPWGATDFAFQCPGMPHLYKGLTSILWITLLLVQCSFPNSHFPFPIYLFPFISILLQPPKSNQNQIKLPVYEKYRGHKNMLNNLSGIQRAKSRM